MRIVLALAVVLMPAAAFAEQAPATARSKVPGVCTKSGEQVSGLTKVCYYTCARSEGALKVTTYEACPSWSTRWRLNRTGHFGPSANSRQ